MNVDFPIILYMRGALTVEDANSLAVVDMTFPSQGVMIAKASAKKGYMEEPGWILDSQGAFYEFTPEKRRREWAAPISFLVQFVLVEYSLSKARRISIRELNERLSQVVDKFAEAPIAEDFRRHLSSYPDEVEISKEIIDAWGI